MNYIPLAGHVDPTVIHVTARDGMPLWATRPIFIGLQPSRPDAGQQWILASPGTWRHILWRQC